MAGVNLDELHAETAAAEAASTMVSTVPHDHIYHNPHAIVPQQHGMTGGLPARFWPLDNVSVQGRSPWATGELDIYQDLLFYMRMAWARDDLPRQIVALLRRVNKRRRNHTDIDEEAIYHALGSIVYSRLYNMGFCAARDLAPSIHMPPPTLNWDQRVTKDPHSEETYEMSELRSNRAKIKLSQTTYAHQHGLTENDVKTICTGVAVWLNRPVEVREMAHNATVYSYDVRAAYFWAGPLGGSYSR